MDVDVVIKGAGEVASGVAHFLFSNGLSIIMTELAQPTAQRRTVAFAEVVFSGEMSFEGIEAVRAESIDDVPVILESDSIPVLVDPEGRVLRNLRPKILVDGRMAKKNLGTDRDDAELVIGLGPGFKAGKDVDVVIETAEGTETGKVIRKGGSIPDTGIPCSIEGYDEERVIRAPTGGTFRSRKDISEPVSVGGVVGEVDGVEVRSKISGTVRGLIKHGLEVSEGQKLGDVDPRGFKEFGISDRSLKIAKGVWKAIREEGEVKL